VAHPGRRSLGGVGRRSEWREFKVALSMLVVLGVVVAEAIHSGQPAWVLIGLIGPAVLVALEGPAVVRHWPRRARH
jgi:hypothetical protein